VPYKTGETPKIGDHVKNRVGRIGIVIEIQQGFGEMIDDKLTIKWDDGSVPIWDYFAGDFSLISRAREG